MSQKVGIKEQMVPIEYRVQVSTHSTTAFLSGEMKNFLLSRGKKTVREPLKKAVLCFLKRINFVSTIAFFVLECLSATGSTRGSTNKQSFVSVRREKMERGCDRRVRRRRHGHVQSHQGLSAEGRQKADAAREDVPRSKMRSRKWRHSVSRRHFE